MTFPPIFLLCSTPVSGVSFPNFQNTTAYVQWLGNSANLAVPNLNHIHLITITYCLLRWAGQLSSQTFDSFASIECDTNALWKEAAGGKWCQHKPTPISWTPSICEACTNDNLHPHTRQIPHTNSPLVRVATSKGCMVHPFWHKLNTAPKPVNNRNQPVRVKYQTWGLLELGKRDQEVNNI
ncbi:hypothetical protein L210DRAFT_3503948 [Boletus edulis BED1]|uniref:Uncharacterized protein n=1 Tax=Boletus edulis BED1 TaxID=1328754 RepID=A0AAD4GED8_BOLED|nr:hypothetical protein L210DRAFT_3503948 [Boletus edulis BED1]